MGDWQEIRKWVLQQAEENPFPKYNHIEIQVLEEDYVEVVTTLQPTSMNFHGTAHGGLYFTMADFCAATTARTDGRRYVTLDAEAHYLKAAKEGKLTAKSHLVHRGRTSCLVEVNVVDEAEQLLFRSLVTMFCTGEHPA